MDFLYTMLSNYIVVLPLVATWYASGKSNISRIRTVAYKAGVYASTYMRRIPGWDPVVEPMIISQMARVFVGMNSFIEGLTSDNTNVALVTESLVNMKDFVSRGMKLDPDSTTTTDDTA
jgi:hypothetical protein